MDALRRVAPNVDRGSYRRWKTIFYARGLEGLIDWRLPPKVEEMPAVVREAICTLRRADPEISVERIVAHVAKHHGFTTSGTTVKRVLHQAGLARRRGPPAGTSSGESRLELGGMKLVEAAIAETGYLSAMSTAVEGFVKDAVALTRSTPGDVMDRDEFGRFLPEYNERFRKEAGDKLGPGFESVEVKREEADPHRQHIAGASREVIQRKLTALLVSPLIGSGRWDGMRVPRGELLGELCGFAYMPSTLDLFARELKYLGISSTLWEVHAHLALEASQGWGTGLSQAVIYVDATTKPVWTELFSHSTKVSQVGRVMPGLEVVSFHLGYGVPLWMSTHSGRAPLVKHVPAMLDGLEKATGSEIGRIVVIDAEGNSIPFLHELECVQSRAWVTRLKPSFVEGHPVFGCTKWRPYRDGDQVRMGRASFKAPEGGEFRMRVVEIRRRTKGTVTYLGASTLLNDLEWRPQDIADLYFGRWPNQEAQFRAVNQAVSFKQVRGYGKELVQNVAVVTKLDHLERRIVDLQERAHAREDEFEAKVRDLEKEQKSLEAADVRRVSLGGEVKERLSTADRITGALRRLSSDATSAQDETHRLAKLVAKRRNAADEAAEKLARTLDDIEKAEHQQKTYEGRRTIFRHDVELDSLFTMLKVGLVFLVTYVLKEYLGDSKMEPVTFLERIAALPARLRVTPNLEIVTFEFNRRDPEMMELLTASCDAINERGLRLQSGRRLRVAVDEPPPPRLPPPRARARRASGQHP